MINRYPIIYIRGFAPTTADKNEAAADPFCGFNLGSTLYRANVNKQKKADKFFFESPLVRLMKEFKYQSVYSNGCDITDPGWQGMTDNNGVNISGIPPTSIIIYRYYDDDSTLLGNGKTRYITEYASGLNKLILRVKELVLKYLFPDGSFLPESDFRCYLVAHSMGGLVARAFLQNPTSEFSDTQKTVAKLFTYATPHNGIDTRLGNVPPWGMFKLFNRKEMKKYLNLQKISPLFNGRVDLIPESALSADRIFCMIGTNRGDYAGMLPAFVGHGSDGLVLIDNASLWGVTKENRPIQAATAYAFRSHSGYFGIVNSEEAYQNLIRFLFGDVRVDILVKINKVKLPNELIALRKKTAGLYQFELCVALQGKRWYLTRRKSTEDSPSCRSHAQLTSDDPKYKKIYLSSVFLSKFAKVKPWSSSLCYALTFAVKKPDYEIAGQFWSYNHFEGADLFHGMAIVEISPPSAQNGNGGWQVKYGWENHAKQYQKVINFTSSNIYHELHLPFNNDGNPGINGTLNMIVRPWF